VRRKRKLTRPRPRADVRREAQQDRDHAEEVAEDSPTAAEYFERLADEADGLA
jgi:hypothetical protein